MSCRRALSPWTSSERLDRGSERARNPRAEREGADGRARHVDVARGGSRAQLRVADRPELALTSPHGIGSSASPGVFVCVCDATPPAFAGSTGVYLLGVLTSPQPQAALSSAGIVFQASAFMWARIASPVVTLIAPLMR